MSILLFQPHQCMICFLKNNTMMKAAENERVSVSWSSKVGIVVTGTLGKTPARCISISAWPHTTPPGGVSTSWSPLCTHSRGTPAPPAWAAPHPKAWDNSEPCVQR